MEDLPLIAFEQKKTTFDRLCSLIDIFELQNLLLKSKLFHEGKQVHVVCPHARELGERRE